MAADQRNCFLLESCGEDQELLRDVQRLLNAAPLAEADTGCLSRAERAITETVAAVSARLGAQGSQEVTSGDNAIYDLPSPEIDGYEILEVLGEGGMGIVYRARQLGPLSRDVAIKVIKPGMDSVEILRRFKLEQEALAKIQHANVATVYEAGTTRLGHPFFAMELVSGVPLDLYCRQNHLSLDDRLRLAITVCDAVAAAHQCHIIHRDLKPSNLLVCEAREGVVVKVIDFGIAKALDTREEDHTQFTLLTQWLGTPYYMSPEQVAQTGSCIDARSDIYALGVLLYELVSDAKPLELHSEMRLNLDKVRHVILEQVPTPPSNKHLFDVFPPSLDWVILKALAKAPDERYPAVRGLRNDLQRVLDREPTLARPTTSKHTLLKQLSRSLELTSTVLRRQALLLVLAAVFAGWLLLSDNNRVTQSRRESLPINERGQATIASTPKAAEGQENSDQTEALAITQMLNYFIAGRFDKLDNYQFPTHADGRLLGEPVGESRRGVKSPSVRRLFAKLATPSPTHSLHLPGEVNDLSLSPDGKLLAIACGDQIVYVLDARAGQAVVRLPTRSPATAVAFSPDNRRLAAGEFEGYVSFYDVDLFQREAWYGSRDGGVESLVWSDTGDYCVAGIRYDHVALFSGQGRPLQRLYMGHGDLPRFTNLRFVPGSNEFLVPLKDGTLHRWDASQLQFQQIERFENARGSSKIDVFQYLGQSESQLIIDRIGCMQLEAYENAQLTPKWTLSTPFDAAFDMAVSTPSQLLGVTYRNGSVLLVDQQTRTRNLFLPSTVHRLHARTAEVASLVWLEDRYLITAARDGYVRYWDLSTLTARSEHALPTELAAADTRKVVSEDIYLKHAGLSGAVDIGSNRYVECSETGVVLRDTGSGRLVASLEDSAPSSVRSCSWSSDGNRLLIASDAGLNNYSRDRVICRLYSTTDNWRTFSSSGPKLLGRIHSDLVLVDDGANCLAVGWNADTEQRELRKYRLSDLSWSCVLPLEHGLEQFVVSQDQSLVACLGDAGLKILDLRTSETRCHLPHWPASHAVFSDENRLLWTMYNSSIEVLHLPTQVRLGEIQLPGAICFSIAADDNWGANFSCLQAGPNGSTILWNVGNPNGIRD